MKTQSNNIDKRENLMDELHMLLEKQIHLLRNSKYEELENLIEKTNSIAAEMAQDPSLLTPRLKNRAQQIKNLYKGLELIIETQKDTVDKQLQKVTCGKRALRTYQNK